MDISSVVTAKFGDIGIKAFWDSFKITPALSVGLLHTHAGYEFHLVLKGQVFLHTEEKKTELSEKDAVIISPEAFHKLEGEDGAELLSFSFFVLRDGKADKTNYYSMFTGGVGEKGFVLMKNNNKILSLVEEIVCKGKLNDAVSVESTKALFVLLFAEIMGVFTATEDFLFAGKNEMSEFDTIVYRVEDYFNEHYMEDVSLKELSTVLHFSEKQLNRIIKKTFGGFNEHLRKIRLKNAKKFLKETKMDVKSVAEAVGYKSYNGFYLAFKNEYNVTPLEYRENK